MTVTSNIHLNIAGWSHTTYAVGARVSNTGNAYQCTTPGTSTSPPTGTGTGINNGGVAVWKYLSGIDYTTLQAWANDTTRFPAVLTAPIVASLWNSGKVVATFCTPILTLFGHTTSSSNTITIRPAAGESFQAVFQAAPTTPYAYNSANGVAFQMPPAIITVMAGAFPNYITPTSGGSLTDASGNIYTITGSQQYFTVNGSQIPTGRSTSAIEYFGGVIYGQDANSGQWYTWNGTAFTVSASPQPAPVSGSFTDGNGDVWTINAVNNGEVYRNGVAPNGQYSTGVVEIALVSGVVWLVNSINHWYRWTGSVWSIGNNPIPVFPTATVTAGSGGSFTDGSGNVWTISSGGQALKNGTAPAFSSGVAMIALVGTAIWQVNIAGQWYTWTGSSWIAPSIIPIIVTNYFQINDNYVTLDGLQFQSQIATNGGSIIGGSGTNLSIQQCIFDCYAQAIGANPIAVSGANLSLTNSLIIGRNTTAGGAMVSTLGGGGAVIANDTFVHASLVPGQAVLDAGLNVTDATETSINNIFYNYNVVYL